MNRVWALARPYAVDALIVIVAVESALEVALRRDSAQAPHTTLWLAVPAIAVIVLLLLGRRRFPFAAPAAVWPLAAALSFVDGRLVVFPVGVLLAGMAAAFLLGNVPDPVQARLGLAIVVSGAAIVVYNQPSNSPGDFIFTPALFVIAWVAGVALRERAAQVEAAEERATHAEREREAAARVAVAEERTRIARELHDIVAHSVSVMVLQVGAVRHKLPEEFEEDKDALRDVEQAGRSALAEMRRLLGAMRLEGQDPELAPQPGLDNLDTLVNEVSRAGLPVRLHVGGDAVPLPRAIELSAYRIVQESLTNALKHARANHADVTLNYGSDELQIEVRDDGQGGSMSDGLGHGHVGIRERVKIYGGEMTAGTATEGGYVILCSAPIWGSPHMSIRVLVADDQSMVRAGFRMLLSGEQDIDVVAEASNGAEAVEMASRFRPTVVLMDIRMPGLDGLQATRRILAADNRARILILTTFDLDEYVYEALSVGASGFVLKDDPPEQLISAVRTVAAGDALLSPSITRRVIRRFMRAPRPAPPKEFHDLTAREQEILRLIADGLSNAEIAEDLYISETTVKTHVTHILQKLNLRDRVQAVVLAYQTGLFESDGSGLGTPHDTSTS